MYINILENFCLKKKKGILTTPSGKSWGERWTSILRFWHAHFGRTGRWHELLRIYFGWNVVTLLPQSCLFLLVNKEASKWRKIKRGQDLKILQWLVPSKKLYFLMWFRLLTKLYGCMSEQCICPLGRKKKKKKGKHTKAFALALTFVNIFQAFKHLHPVPW